MNESIKELESIIEKINNLEQAEQKEMAMFIQGYIAGVNNRAE